jgi:hypothetical protein
MNQPTYLLVSKNSPSCIQALEDLKNIIDIEPQLKVLWIEDHNEVLPHHPTLTKLIKNRISEIEKRPMLMPSIAHFNLGMKEYTHHDRSDYLQFISNFIRDKKKQIMDQHLAHINSHPPMINQAVFHSEKMLNHVKAHAESLPTGHFQQSIENHLEHTNRNYGLKSNPHVSFTNNMMQHAKLQAQHIYDQTLAKEKENIERFKSTYRK